MLFVTNLFETLALLLKTVKLMLYLGNVLVLRYVLMYNLEVCIFQFSLNISTITQRQLSVIKMFNVQ